MQALKRNQIAARRLPREEVPVPELGGTVTVVGMGYSRRVLFLTALRRAGAIDGGAGDLTAGAVMAMAPAALADAVLADDGEPVYDIEGWEHFGQEHRAAVEKLTGVLLRLSGFSSEEARKNS